MEDPETCLVLRRTRGRISVEGMNFTATYGELVGHQKEKRRSLATRHGLLHAYHSSSGQDAEQALEHTVSACKSASRGAPCLPATKRTSVPPRGSCAMVKDRHGMLRKGENGSPRILPSLPPLHPNSPSNFSILGRNFSAFLKSPSGTARFA